MKRIPKWPGVERDASFLPYQISLTTSPATITSDMLGYWRFPSNWFHDRLHHFQWMSGYVMEFTDERARA